MTTSPVDMGLSMQAGSQDDMVQQKLRIDNLKKNLTGDVDKDKKLREACQGFESVFIQKMWEQMRKNVQKEGYLHSKDEETYQGMFDQEFSKKMSEAGGIGLADMLYEQLNQRLADGSRNTNVKSGGVVLPSGSSPSTRFGRVGENKGEQAEAKDPTALDASKIIKKNSQEDLYSMLPEEELQAEAGVLPELVEDVVGLGDRQVLNTALAELRAEVGGAGAAKMEGATQSTEHMQTTGALSEAGPLYQQASAAASGIVPENTPGVPHENVREQEQGIAANVAEHVQRQNLQVTAPDSPPPSRALSSLKRQNKHLNQAEGAALSAATARQGGHVRSHPKGGVDIKL